MCSDVVYFHLMYLYRNKYTYVESPFAETSIELQNEYRTGKQKDKCTYVAMC